jgi:hypothetical protein
MDKLKFIDSLDEEQSGNAVRVAQMAKKAGVDPNLAVAIAFKESGLRTNAPRGASGEIGMMQVMPSTGKGLGYDEEKLSIPNQNIKAGIEYLKLGLQASENDPTLAAIYYNGGPGAVEALKLGKDPDPRVFDYVRALNGYGTFDTGPKPAQRGESDLVLGDAPPPAPPPAADTSSADPAERFLFGGAGAAAGALATGKSAYDTQRTSTLANRAGAEERARILAQRSMGVPPPAIPPGSPGVQGVPGQGVIRQPGAPAAGGLPTPVGPADAGRMAKGQTGVIPYNTAKALGLTDIEAGQALSNTKQEGGAWDLAKKRAENTNAVKNLFPGERYVENPRFGGLLTPDQGVGGGPRASYVYQGASEMPPGHMAGPAAPPPAGSLVQLPKPPPIPTTPPPPGMGARVMSGLDAVTNMFKGMMRPVVSAVGTVGKYALPPAAGLSAGLDLADIVHEYDKPADQRDLTKMGLKAASLFGGGLSMVSPPAALVGIPLSLGATAAQAYRDDPEYFKQKIKEYTGYSP